MGLEEESYLSEIRKWGPAEYADEIEEWSLTADTLHAEIRELRRKESNQIIVSGGLSVAALIDAAIYWF